MEVKGNFKPFTRFLGFIRAGLSKSPVARRLWQRAADDYVTRLNRQGDAAREALEDFYPPPPGGRPLERRYTWPDGTSGHKFASPKSQRFFFGVILARGLVPYRRTGNLRRSTTGTVEEVLDHGFIIRWSVDLERAPYAPFVIGDRQFYYHEITGWATLDVSAQRAFEVSTGGSGVLATQHPFLPVLAGYVADSAANV